MKTLDLCQLLQQHPYPGRGIVLGRSADDQKAVIAYFIMGRSENSRNRVFEATEDGIRTRAYDESKMTDPSLIIYHPVRMVGRGVVVTNGDQTDTIRDYLLEGRTFAEALRTRCFEPDPPNYTPRISGLAEPREDRYRLSILKSADGDPSSVRRCFYEYTAPKAGRGHFIHTYQGDGNPLPSFEGEPAEITLKGDIDAFTEEVWNSLNADNRVSLFTRYIRLSDGKTETRLVNKNQ